MDYTRFIRIIFSLCVFLSAYAFSAWNGSISEPEKKSGVYLIKTPEEFAWLANQNTGSRGSYISAKLENDIYFADNKDSVNREHSIGTITAEIKLDGNGYTVYGLYTDSSVIISNLYSNYCDYSYQNLKFKNFEMNYVGSSGIVIPMRHSYRCDGKLLGDIVFDGKIKVNVSGSNNAFVAVCGFGYENGIAVNRASIEVSGSGSVSAHGVCLGATAMDSTTIRESVNYGDVTVTGSMSTVFASGFEFSGYPQQSSSPHWYTYDYKLTNYGNITVDNTYSDARLSVAGIYPKEVSMYKDSIFTINSTNYGSINVTARQAEFSVAGLFTRAAGNLYMKKADNRGDVTVKVSKGYSSAGFTSKANRVGGLFASVYVDNSNHMENSFLNVGNIDVEGSPNVCDSWGSCTELNVGGVAGVSSGQIYNALNLGNINVVGSGLINDHEINVGGIVGLLNDTLELSANLGKVTATTGTSLGGLAGFIDDGDLIKCSNFGPVTGKDVAYVGGLAGYMDGSCSMSAGHCYHESHSIIYDANYADVYAYGKVSKAAGIITDTYTTVYNSFSAGKVLMQDSTKTDESLIPGRPISGYDFKQSFYDWEVFGAQDSIREWDKEKKLTKYMRSSDFVNDLNFRDSTDSDVKVWKLNSEINPYPVIAELEDLLVFANDPALPIRRVVSSSAVAFDLQIQGRNLVLTAKAGTPYAVFNLLGKKVVQGRLNGMNEVIPLQFNPGRYIVRVGKASRSIVIH